MNSVVVLRVVPSKDESHAALNLSIRMANGLHHNRQVKPKWTLMGVALAVNAGYHSSKGVPRWMLKTIEQEYGK